MECQDARLLLAFVDRPIEELDEGERKAVMQHLEICPICAEMAQADRRADEMVGAALRDVPVPSDLRQKVQNRLSAGRTGSRWKWGLSAAAVFIIVTAGAFAWYGRAHPEVKVADLEQIALDGSMEADRAGNRTPADVERYLAERGINVKVPSDFFDFQNFRDVDIVDFKGRQVPKLTFERRDNGQTISANVLILSRRNFRMSELKDDLLIPGSTSVQIYRVDEFVNVIFFRGGDLTALRGRQMPQN